MSCLTILNGFFPEGRLVKHYPFNITLIDTRLQGSDDFAAAYLMVHDGKAAFIETGTNHSVPDLIAALHAQGLSEDDVVYVMPTHVHLDHAGGAGNLMARCKNATLVIHPRGAFHMHNPSKLQVGAEAVYGKKRVAETYGDLIPVPEERMIIIQDNQQLDFNGRELLFLDTPGHAKHHYCIYDLLSEGVFSGDTFGLSYRQFDVKDDVVILPTTSPVQFDPDALKQSIQRIASLQPVRIFLTHYGMIENIQPLVARLHQQIDELVLIAKKFADSKNRTQNMYDAILRLFIAEMEKVGSDLDLQEAEALLKADITLNVAGLEVWLDYQAR